jgi:carbamoyl-phosphate synthase small subunit
MTTYLTLENGMTFTGASLGLQGDAAGELVLATGMTGYLETLTDPSHYGQIVLQTFPLAGNFGVIPEEYASDRAWASAYIVKYASESPSNFRCKEKLDDFLKSQGIVGLQGIDTRALARVLRESGAMNARISPGPLAEADVTALKRYAVRDAVAAVSPKTLVKSGSGRRVAMLNLGAKQSIAGALVKRGCEVWSFPHDTPAPAILTSQPQGIVVSNGPGNPEDPANQTVVDTIKALIQSGLPVFGLCLGHQLLAMAQGHTVRKLTLGHRGANQPVKDSTTGKLLVTNQNHGYAVNADKPWLVNVTDGTCEGIDYGLSFGVQFHPNNNTEFVYDRYIERMEAHAAR